MDQRISGRPAKPYHVLDLPPIAPAPPCDRADFFLSLMELKGLFNAAWRKLMADRQEADQPIIVDETRQ